MRLALALALVVWACGAQAACRQALVLGLDVSGSVDAREYRLQTDGVAAALQHPEVRAAFLALPDLPVALAVFEWSGQGAQRLLVDWTDITSPEVLDDVATRLRATTRVEMALSTALGEAKAHGAALLSARPDCAWQVLDISGDGKSNTGPRPQDVVPPGITVNALVIGEQVTGQRAGPGIGELSAYFNAYVIEGPEAFVETALGFEAFEAAMVRKLKRELQVLVIGAR